MADVRVPGDGTRTERGGLLIEGPAGHEARTRAAEQSRDRRQRTLQLWFNGALVLASFLTMGIVIYQNYILRRSLVEMETTNQHALRALAQADAGLEMNRTLVTATTDANLIYRDQARSAAEQAALSRRQFDASVEAERLSRRAWVMVSRVELAELPVGKPARALLHVTNTGSTPATDVAVGGSLFGRRDYGSIGSNVKPDGPIRSAVTLAPNMVISVILSTSEAISQGYLDTFAAGRTQLFAVGEIHYSDVFGRRHQTEYCFSLDAEAFQRAGIAPSPIAFAGCPAGNSVR